MSRLTRPAPLLTVLLVTGGLMLGGCGSEDESATDTTAAAAIDTAPPVTESTPVADTTLPASTAPAAIDLTGQELTIKNTIQIAAPASTGGTGGVETPIEVLLGAPADALTGKGTVGSAVEFPGFITLWDVDVSSNEIRFTNVVKAEPRPGFFRVIEKDTFDRYYVSTAEGFTGRSATTDNPAVKAEIKESGELLITVGEGYDNRGTGFTVSLS